MDIQQAMASAMASITGEPEPPPWFPEHYHWLLRLPPAFWARMACYLDYSEILRLAQLSRQFNQVRLEQYLAWTVRHAAVAQRDIGADALGRRSGGGGGGSADGGSSTQRFACYLCFRMRSAVDFQQSATMFKFARVRQRNPYTGRRSFERARSPPPELFSSVVRPPPMPFPAGVPAGPSVLSPGLATGMGTGLGTGLGMGGVGGILGGASPTPIRGSTGMTLTEANAAALVRAVTGRSHLRPVRRVGFVPQAPGAEVGQIENLRRYCLDCALGTGLATVGDHILTNDGRRLYVCRCPALRLSDTSERCPNCNMFPVLRD